jgi:hypothetical protein
MIVQTTSNLVKLDGPQPDGPMVRMWTPAGSSHTTGPFMQRTAEANRRDLGMGGGVCPADYANTFPLQYVMGAAMVGLNRWVAGGAAPLSLPRLTVTQEGPKGDVARDEVGNPIGGVRTPWVDAPVARYEWKGDCLGGAGRTFPLSPAELKARYGTPDAYRRQFSAAARKAEQQGVLLSDDVKAAIAEAAKQSF